MKPMAWLFAFALSGVFAGGAPAQEPVQAATKANPEVEKHLKSGNEAFAARKYEDAERDYKKALKAAHDSCFACWEDLAQTELYLGDRKAARDDAAKAIPLAAAGRESAEAHILRGILLSKSNENTHDADLPGAEAEYRAAVAAVPGDAEPHLGLALVLFRQNKDDEGRAEARRCIELEPSGVQAEYARKLIANPRHAEQALAPGFQVTNAQGEPIALKSFEGRYVVLDFWATWCPPCRASVGELKELTKKYPSNELVVLSVSGDRDEAKWREFIAKKQMDWEQYRDSDDKLFHLYNVQAIPTYVVIDRDGFIRERIMDRNPQASIVYRLKDTLATLTAEKH